MLQARGIMLHLQNVEILGGIDFDVRAGEILGLIGPNGSGKSSLLKLLSGLWSSNSVTKAVFSGDFSFQGRSLAALTPRERARWITYVGAELFTEFPMSAADAIWMGSVSVPDAESPDLRSRFETVVDETGCRDFLSRELSTLSSGERQRVAIARALVQGSPLVCLDESLSKLDLHHQAEMGNLLKSYCARGRSFLLVSHDLNFTTDWADRALILHRGRKVAEGPVAQTVTEENLRRIYPGARFTLHPHPVTGALKAYFKI